MAGEALDAFELAPRAAPGCARKAEAAQRAGHFVKEIAPVTITERGKTTEVSVDEHPRHGSTIEALRKLPLTFPKVEGHDGIITAGGAGGTVGSHNVSNIVIGIPENIFVRVNALLPALVDLALKSNDRKAAALFQ